MNSFIILSILFFTSCTSAAFTFDGGINLIFIGSNSSDFKNVTFGANFTAIKNTKYFNVSRATVAFTYGWNTNFASSATKAIIKAYLTRNDSNIIIIDWSKYSMHRDYRSVAAVVKNSSLFVVDIFRQMQNAGFNLSTFHLVGHSLGAQLLGRVGSNYNAMYNFQFERITGLDPAGPMFRTTNVTIDIGIIDINIKFYPTLSKNDAKFVDIIHTNSGEAGSSLSTGHFDFWPNGGLVQTNCFLCNPFLDDCFTCSHSRSWKYYAESVTTSTHKFIAKKCANNVKIHSSLTCTGPSTASMGYYANRYSDYGNYFLTTNGSPSYSK